MTYTNRFYSEFDTETFSEITPLDYRTPFQRERDRIIHSSAFRRLQAKTQVFMSGEYDFYRTRLTHSIEVAQIGRSICHYLKSSSPLLADDFFIDSDLVEAACLAHDLGHPPFRHAGERILNRLMRDHGGFEGNAQTLRMLTEIIYSGGGERRGMNPTRALLDAILKYKTLYSELEKPENHFIYDRQEPYLRFVFGDRPYRDYLEPGKARNGFRSIECRIMDWADDTAYSVNDVVDGINAGFIGPGRVEKWGAEKNLDGFEAELLEQLLRTMREGSLERTFARKIGRFIQACTLTQTRNFMSEQTNRYRFHLTIDPEVRAESRLYKRLALDLVFRAPQLHQLDFKWNQILSRMFIAFKENYLSQTPGLKIISGEADTLIRRESDSEHRVRLLCDHLAGMTDGFAIRTFKRLFDPDFGSIVDLV